jgi:hypothetical protein
MSRTIMDINTTLADALGIDYHNVTGITIRLAAGDVPRVTVERIIRTPGEADPIAKVLERFTLRPDDGE